LLAFESGQMIAAKRKSAGSFHFSKYFAAQKVCVQSEAIKDSSTYVMSLP
jgi:hypothetical protein